MPALSQGRGNPPRQIRDSPPLACSSLAYFQDPLRSVDPEQGFRIPLTDCF